MIKEKIAVFNTSSLDQWKQFRLNLPGLPPARKQFLKEEMGLHGMEVSLNCMLPGQAMPFVHRHKNNEELYIFLTGNGEFQADGDIVQIEPGTCIRCTPDVCRAWRNTGDTEMQFIVIQSPFEPMETANIQDGETVEQPLHWQ